MSRFLSPLFLHVTGYYWLDIVISVLVTALWLSPWLGLFIDDEGKENVEFYASVIGLPFAWYIFRVFSLSLNVSPARQGWILASLYWIVLFIAASIPAVIIGYPLAWLYREFRSSGVAHKHKHNFVFVKKIGTCMVEEKCSICGETRLVENHSFGPVQYIGQGCETGIVCEKCGIQRPLGVSHQWGPWQEVPNECRKVRVCQRCGKEESKDLPHKWGVWQYESPTSCKQVRFCLRCYARETRPPKHKWSDWEFVAPGKQRRICYHCHQQEYRDV